jgi:hypothetical protein
VADNKKIRNVDKKDPINSSFDTKLIFLGEVVDINDPLNEGRIKVRIAGVDNDSVVDNKTQPGSSKTFKRVYGDKKYRDLSGGVIDEEEPIEEIIQNPKTIRSLQNSKIKTKSNNTQELPWCLPLLPKHIQILPKKGEMVKVIMYDIGPNKTNRIWVGPVISQKNYLGFQTVLTSGDLMETSLFKDRVKNVSENRKLKTSGFKVGEFTGGFPEKTDIAIMSRGNADIVLPNPSFGEGVMNMGGEVLIRAGKFKFNTDNLELNTTNPGYIRLKTTDITSDTPKTRSLIFSDSITLYSYSNEKVGKIYRTPLNPIMGTDTEITDAHNSLSPLIRGDVLVEFLLLIKDYVKNHNHPYHKHPSTNANSKEQIEKFDLESLLSRGIRIN